TFRDDVATRWARAVSTLARPARNPANRDTKRAPRPEFRCGARYFGETLSARANSLRRAEQRAQTLEHDGQDVEHSFENSTAGFDDDRSHGNSSCSDRPGATGSRPGFTARPWPPRAGGGCGSTCKSRG